MTLTHFDAHAGVAVSPSQDTYEMARDAVDSVYVPHTNFDDTLKKVLKRIERNIGRKRGQRSLLVTGLAGAGKTTLIDKILERFPKVKDGCKFELDDGTVGVCDSIPVVHAECPTKPSEKAIVTRLLKTMGDPLASKRRDLEDLKDLLRKYLKAGETAAVIFDESQRPTDRKGKILQGEIATLFQEIHNEGCVVILVGLARAEALLDGDTQVERRWARPLRLAQYQWGGLEEGEGFGPDSRYIFMGLLKAVANVVEFEWSKDIDFNQEESAFRFYYATQGLVGYLKVLMRGAIDVLEETDGRTITSGVLAEAFEAEFRSEPKTGNLQNPFRDSFKIEMPPPLPDDAMPLYTRSPRASSKKTRRADLTNRLTLQ